MWNFRPEYFFLYKILLKRPFLFRFLYFPPPLCLLRQASDERQALERQLSEVESELVDEKRNLSASRDELKELRAGLRSAHATLAGKEAEARDYAKQKEELEDLREKQRVADDAVAALESELREMATERDQQLEEHEALKVKSTSSSL